MGVTAGVLTALAAGAGSTEARTQRKSVEKEGKEARIAAGVEQKRGERTKEQAVMRRLKRRGAAGEARGRSDVISTRASTGGTKGNKVLLGQ